jgi:DNA modification methylase
MGGEKAQLCFTSPPYWVGKSYETQTSLQEIKDFVRNIAKSCVLAVTQDGGRIVINTSTAMARAINPKADVETLFALAWWQDSLREESWLMRHCRLWVKRGQLAAPRVSAKADVIDQHWETVAEFLPTFYCPDGLRRGQEKIGVKWAQQGVWDDIHGEANMKLHGAAFPVELPKRYIKLYTTENERLFEPFNGTGTTIIACEQLGRKCRAIEISPGYVAVAIQRWADATGKDPKKL